MLENIIELQKSNETSDPLQKHENITSHSVNNDLTNYLTFITMLSRDRSPENTSLIDDYIKSETNSTKRIQYIEYIDKQERNKEKLTSKQSKKQSNPYTKKPSGKQLKFFRTNILQYILGTRKHINKFTRKTRVADSSIILKPRITHKAYKYYKYLLMDIKYFLKEPIEYILTNEWARLDVKHYNIIVDLDNAIKHILLANDMLQNPNINITYKKLYIFIKPYLYLLIKPDFIRYIEKALNNTIAHNHKFKAQLPKIISLIKSMLNTNSHGISLYNIIKAIVILHYRIKPPTLKDMLAHYNIKEIENTKYKFNNRVKTQLKQRLRKYKQQYLRAEQELFTLQFIDTSFNIHIASPYKNKKYIYSLFEKVYSYKDEHAKTDNLYTKTEYIQYLKQLQDDVITPVLRFINGFIHIYSSFLSGKKLSLETPEKSIIHRHIVDDFIFTDDISKLKNIADELQSFKENNAYIVIDFSTYEKFNTQGRIGAVKEDKACELIRLSAISFYNITNKISNALYRHYITYRLNDDDKLLLHSNQATTIGQVKDIYPKLVPFAQYKIHKFPFLSSMSVIEVLNEINSFSINYCNLFIYEPIIRRLENKFRHFDKTEQFLKIKSKIPTTYMEE